MERIETSTKHTDKFGSGKHGFRGGSPAGTDPTRVSPEIFNAIQEELARAVEATGLPLKTAATETYEQLAQCIRAGVADAAFSNWEDRAYVGTIGNNGADAACLFDSPSSDTERWIIVHLGGEISRSADRGDTWVEDTSPTVNSLRAVCSNGAPGTPGTLFVAVGDNGTIITSAGTGSWTTRTPDASYSGHFQHVFHGNGLFVALGASGEIQTSPDGITWTRRTPAASYSNTFSGGAYGGGLYVIVGYAGEIQTSPDGITWTHRTAAASYAGAFVACAYGNGAFVAVGSGPAIQRSLDGITWSSVSIPSALTDFYDIAFCAGLFVCVATSEGVLGVAIDGTDWRVRRFNGNGSMNGIGVGPGRLMIATTNVPQRSLRASQLFEGY